MGRQSGGIIVAVLLTLLLSGCSAPSSTSSTPVPDPSMTAIITDTPTPTASPAAESETPTTSGTPVDVSRFPDDIAAVTVADMQAVIDALDDMQNRIATAVAAQGIVGPEALVIIEGYASKNFESRYTGYWDNDFIDRLAEEPGPVRSTVLDIVGLDPDLRCIALLVEHDYSAMMRPGQDIDENWYIGLLPKDADDPAAASDNPTGYEVGAEFAAIEGNDVPCGS